MSRSIFIWYAFLGIAVTTYLGSIVGEYAVDQWTVTVSKIEKRVDRYEKKAELKRWFQGSKKLKLNGKGSHDSLSSNVDSQTLLQIRNDSQEASSSTDTPKVPPAIIVPSAHLKHTRSSSVVVSETGPFLDSEAPEELLHAHSVPSGHQNALHHFVRLDQPDTMATDRLARRLFSSFKTRHGGATESESTDLMATSSEEGESRNEQQDPSRGRLKVLRKRTARRLLSGFKTSPRPPLPPNRRHEGSDDPSNDPSAPLLGP